ncbi:MAG TPA: CocE/NonD family hydrolase [Steroidobacteraceae bacterium]|nr:CocE/NonD family hydrolase [Steroidobacteraceae bacterium]
MRNTWAVVLVLVLSASPGRAQAYEKPSPPVYGFTLERATIPMRDGVTLAVTLYMPKGGPHGVRFPALLNYLPYRKDDDEIEEQYGLFSYFARRGFVGAAVDIRGFGASGGTPPNREYSAQEQADGEQVIAWVAHQPWSNGNVGMFGISWGGFNSIQLAMRNPPALKAIVAVAATENLFKEDVHYIDGVAHIDEFELTMDLGQGRSGAPDYSLAPNVIEPRMSSKPWSLTYLEHQRDGAFWHSPERPLSSIRVPCFLIGGLHDGYRDSIPRMLTQVSAPVKAWIGPWNHAWPSDSNYGPLYEWRNQAVRWFDYWLKGRNTGVLSDPKLMIYLQLAYPPGPQDQTLPGLWRAYDGWPPQGTQPERLFLQPDHALAPEAGKSGRDELRYVPSAGAESGIFWWGDLHPDMRSFDAYSLVYDSQPLTDDTAIIGYPHLTLNASSSAPLADWVARLEDVAPDGRVTLVVGADSNGAQRDSLADPSSLEPGKAYTFSFDLHLASYVFPKGHRIRLALANAMWPTLWPTPYSMDTTVELGGERASWIELPRVPLAGRAPPASLFSPPEPVEKPPGITGGGFDWPGSYTVQRDETGHAHVTWQGGYAIHHPWGTFHDAEKITYSIDDAHPADTSDVGDIVNVQHVGAHTLTWRGHLSLRSDAHNFYYQYTRALLRDEKLVISRTWKKTIPRDHQ